jgi:hypothetical protein
MKEICTQNGKLYFRSDDLLFLEHIVDWKAYLSVGLNAYCFKGITEHHSFKVGKAQNGEIQLLYKEWRSVKEWQGSFVKSSGVVVFPQSKIQQVPLPIPHYWKPILPIETPVLEVISKLTRSMEASGVATKVRLDWFSKFCSIQAAPSELPKEILTILSLVAPIPEEEQQAPLPPQITHPACEIVAHVPRVSAALYADRDPQVEELVVIEMNEADRSTWPAYYYWLGRVLKCPKGRSKDYTVLWYSCRDGKFNKSSEKVSSNVWKVDRSTILFSGFSLTSTHKLYTSNERAFMEHPRIKQFV